ncbi:hypothetical protein GZH53_18220 [Flavihumibacter sp. R14]|nr:hypothetical protein [Flavihumibacter soli]
MSFRSSIKCLFILTIIFGTACRKGQQEQAVVFSNDFEEGNLQHIAGGIITTFNNTRVMGRYNNGGFGLQLDNLPGHDLVEVSFDLYIHDSWDGNDADPDGPDKWTLEVEGVNFINTTFSNKECPYTCFPQSYPLNYLNSNQQPKTGALPMELPGACHWADRPRGTTLYKIVKRIRHSSPSFTMRSFDELYQSNTGEQLCDESWSVDNLVVKTINLD